MRDVSASIMYMPGSVLVFLGLALGIVLASLGNIYLTGAVLAGLIAVTVFYVPGRRKTLIVLIFAVAGLIYFNCTTVKPVGKMPDLNMTLTGRVDSFPTGGNGKISFYLNTTEPNIYLRRLKVNAYFPLTVRPGDTIEIKGILKPPPAPSNPGEFDYPAYLARRDVFYILTVKNDKDLSLVKPQPVWQSWITASRVKGEQAFAAVLPDQEAAILSGMLLGKIDEIDPESNIDFQKTGIFHVFSVSGLHIGFLLLLNGWIMSLLKTGKRTRFISGLTLLLLYGFLAGWPVSLQRAAIMGGLGLLAYYSGRLNNMLNALALAGVVILAVNPAALLDISFQLSFAATFGLIYIFPLVKARINSKRWWDLVLVPLCAEIMIVPLVAWYFNLFSPISIVANLLTTYITGGIVILGFLGFLAAQVTSFLAPIFLYPAGALIEILLGLVELLKNVPGAYHWTGPGLIIVLLYYAGLGVLLWSIATNRQKLAGAALAGMALIIAGFYIPAGWDNPGRLKAVFLDVGQGDCILLKTPGGKFILVDGGGSQFFDVGSLKVLPYLHRCSINELFMVINTHPDLDHLNGLETLVANTRVRHLAVPASLYNAPEYEHWKKSAGNKIIPLKRGQTIKLEDGFYLKILLPDGAAYALNNYNNHSLVLEVGYGKFKMLLTGDVEEEAIERLMAQKSLTPVTVVKVPHHGSRNSAVDDFYDVTQPAYAVISAGRNNSFGHPHIEVLNMLEGKGINILRTDRQGAIIMITDGRGLKLESK